MTRGERAVAVRAIAAMSEFARLVDSAGGDVAIDRETRLIDANNPEVVLAKFRRLVQQHRSEWDGFTSVLPERSWVRDIVGQL